MAITASPMNLLTVPPLARIGSHTRVKYALSISTTSCAESFSEMCVKVAVDDPGGTGVGDGDGTDLDLDLTLEGGGVYHFGELRPRHTADHPVHIEQEGVDAVRWGADLERVLDLQKGRPPRPDYNQTRVSAPLRSELGFAWVEFASLADQVSFRVLQPPHRRSL